MPIVAHSLMFVALGGLCTAAPTSAEDPSPKNDAISVTNTVKLDLQITGVERGWKIEVKPAHPGSRFRPVVRQIEESTSGPVQLDLIAIDAQSLSADRDCALAIVLTDPEGTSQTFKRSVRLLPQPDTATVPELSKTFYLRTSTIASRETPGRRPN